MLALRLDYLVGALTDLAASSERRVDRMLNPDVQEFHLPPFLTPESGLWSGYMLAQYTAATMVNEYRSVGRPASDNTPVSGTQEDHVSMSSTSAFAARRTVANVQSALAVELVCAAQAAGFVGEGGPESTMERRKGDGNSDGGDDVGDSADEPGGADLTHGVGTGATYEAVRAVVPPLVDGRPVHEDVAAADALVASGTLDAALAEALAEAGEEIE